MNRSAYASRGTFVLVVLLLCALVSSQAQVTFSVPVSYAVGTNPGSTISADLNGDGIPDLAVANAGDAAVNDLGSVSILLGKGDGTFYAASDVAAGGFPAILIAADFNGDGKSDLFVEGQSANGMTLVPWSILLGHGDGTFGAPIQLALTNFTSSIVVGDFNNDTKPDLVFIDQTSGDLQELLGNGDGTFQPAQSLGTSGLTQVVAGDFNGDGNPDLAGDNQLLLANGDGTFRKLSFALDGAPSQLLAVDVNGDGRSDLLAIMLTTSSDRRPTCELLCFSYTNYHLMVNLANADGTLQPALQLASAQARDPQGIFPRIGTEITFAMVGDFDGDGRLDVAYQQVTIGSSPSLVLLRGKGNGTFSDGLGSVSGLFNVDPTTIDLNSDKLADLVAYSSQPHTIKVVMNATEGFWLASPASFGPVPAGGSATGTVSVNAQNGFTNPVSLTCSAPQFAGIQCSLSSSSVAPGTDSKLTVTTTGNSGSWHSPGWRPDPQWFYALCLPFGGILFAGLGFSCKQYGSHKHAGVATTGLLLAGMVFQVACGGESRAGGGTPTGDYTITVTGTAGTISRSTTVNLTVR